MVEDMTNCHLKKSYLNFIASAFANNFLLHVFLRF